MSSALRWTVLIASAILAGWASGDGWLRFLATLAALLGYYTVGAARGWDAKTQDMEQVRQR